MINLFKNIKYRKNHAMETLINIAINDRLLTFFKIVNIKNIRINIISGIGVLIVNTAGKKYHKPD